INNTQTPTLIPLENSLRSTQPATGKCQHCESMVKHFLYLESLIRNNYNPKSQCGLCYSSLKYLQLVNKSIMQIFGNVEEIVHTAKTFSAKQTRQTFAGSRPIAAKSPAKSPMKTSSKKNIARKRLKGGKVRGSVLQKSAKTVSKVRLAGGGKLITPDNRHEKNKTKLSKVKTAASTPVRLQSTLKGRRKKSQVDAKISGVKQTHAKSKRNRVGTLRIRG
ncbi:PREDICTED: uncharacterized protein LOC108357502, partial [Rhagoletis zephyria]|uniref:uncharacterized protein LOC108357502 n=1 Tax=Rhagoletis zephyria TaxID=28612 RepID=UPI0008112835